MAVLSPHIHIYHCICTSLLLASTHTLSSLPRRAAPSLDGAYILPVPSQPPSFSSSRSPSLERESKSPLHQGQDAEQEHEPMETSNASKDEKEVKSMRAIGYTLLVGMQKDSKMTIIRREDGFEKRFLWRCGRCALVVGYEITGPEDSGLGGREREGEEFDGKVAYLLPNGILSTGTMVQGKKIGEGNVEIGGEGGGVGVWE